LFSVYRFDVMHSRPFGLSSQLRGEKFIKI